jgi:hypothetical protein
MNLKIIILLSGYTLWTCILYAMAKAVTDIVRDRKNDNVFVRFFRGRSKEWYDWVIGIGEEGNYWRREWSYFRDLWHWAEHVKLFALWLLCAVLLTEIFLLLGFGIWSLVISGVVAWLGYFLTGRIFILLYHNWFR